MDYLQSFRNPALAQQLVAAIQALAGPQPLRVMEICGGHTHAIFRHGLNRLLEGAVTFVHGPGCPVCVVPLEKVDQALELARRPEVILATYADMMRVPGRGGSLFEARADGAGVRMVYSPLEALQLARDNPEHQVVFLAIGFETTTPPNAMSVLMAQQEGLANYSLLSNHVLVPPAMRALLGGAETQAARVDAILAPGHVSVITGSAIYRFMAGEFAKPVVISGFEPLDILQSAHMLLAQARQMEAGRAAPQVEIQYRRAVTPQGNPQAQAVVNQVLAPRTVRWRGLGEIPASGLGLRPEFAAFDAEARFALAPPPPAADPKACRCGDILRGLLEPPGCPAYNRACTPDHPLGACMVSSEGACAAWHRYGAPPESHSPQSRP